MNLRAMALERKVKRLKNDLSGAKQIIDTLNLRLSDLIQVAEVGSEQSVNAWNEYVSLVHIREIINE